MTSTPTTRKRLTGSAGRRTLSRHLALPALALTIAALTSACGSDNASRSSEGSSSTPGQIGTRSTAVGTILTDDTGRTMYAFAADDKGVSNCADSCLTYWPPVSASGASAKALKAGSGVTAHLGTITGTDGKKQLTIDGWPMYTYVGDHGPGETNGQGLDESGGLWWVVAPDGTWIKGSSGSGSSSDGTPGGYGQGGGY